MNETIKQLKFQINQTEKSLSRAMYLRDNEAIDDYTEELFYLKGELKKEIEVWERQNEKPE